MLPAPFVRLVPLQIRAFEALRWAGLERHANRVGEATDPDTLRVAAESALYDGCIEAIEVLRAGRGDNAKVITASRTLHALRDELDRERREAS